MPYSESNDVSESSKSEEFAMSGSSGSAPVDGPAALERVFGEQKVDEFVTVCPCDEVERRGLVERAGVFAVAWPFSKSSGESSEVV